MKAFIHDYWPVFLFGVAVAMGFIKWFIGHYRMHRAIDERLAWGKDRFDRNDKDHEMLIEKTGELSSKLGATVTGVRELLVHEGLRKPGQSINGED